MIGRRLAVAALTAVTVVALGPADANVLGTSWGRPAAVLVVLGVLVWACWPLIELDEEWREADRVKARAQAYQADHEHQRVVGMAERMADDEATASPYEWRDQ